MQRPPQFSRTGNCNTIGSRLMMVKEYGWTRFRMFVSWSVRVANHNHRRNERNLQLASGFRCGLLSFILPRHHFNPLRTWNELRKKDADKAPLLFSLRCPWPGQGIAAEKYKSIVYMYIHFAYKGWTKCFFLPLGLSLIYAFDNHKRICVGIRQHLLSTRSQMINCGSFRRGCWWCCEGGHNKRTDSNSQARLLGVGERIVVKQDFH